MCESPYGLSFYPLPNIGVPCSRGTIIAVTYMQYVNSIHVFPKAVLPSSSAQLNCCWAPGSSPCGSMSVSVDCFS
jgi:hypothetical protein